MFDERFILACELVGDTRFYNHGFDDFAPAELPYVRAMFEDRSSAITEDESFFSIMRQTEDGTSSVVIQIPKGLMAYDGYLRNAYSYQKCNALDRLFGFQNTRHDYGGLNIVDLGDQAKYAVCYLSVRLEYPDSPAKPLVATIAKPEPGVTFLAWICAAKGKSADEILADALPSNLQAAVITRQDGMVLCAIEADASGGGPAAQAAWNEYWENRTKASSYTSEYSYG